MHRQTVRRGTKLANMRNVMYQRDFAACLNLVDSDSYLVSAFPKYQALSPLARMLLVELSHTLTNDYLVKVDRMSMAHSVELRSPFLDHKLIEAAVYLPDHDRMLWHGPGKRILRRLYGHLLPPKLLTKPKAGFSVPIDSWLRGPLLDTLRNVLLDERVNQRGIFQTEALEQMIDRHVRHVESLGHVLWTVLMLELWLRRFIDDPQPSN